MNTITDDININNLQIDDVFGDDFPSYYHDDDSDDEDQVLYSKSKKSNNNSSKYDNVTGYRATVWLPPEQLSKISTSGVKGNNANNDKSIQRQIIEQRNHEISNRNKVEDGMSAPKLTGINRHKPMSLAGVSGTHSNQNNNNKTSYVSANPADMIAVKFCLNFLYSMIKNDKLDYRNDEICHMITPFLPLLAHCLKLDDAADVSILALKNICILLSWDINLKTSFSASFPRLVGNQILKLMFKGGALLTTDRELVQACIKGLCSLFKNYGKKSTSSNNSNTSINDNNITSSLPDMIISDPSIINLNDATQKHTNTKSKKRDLSTSIEPVVHIKQEMPLKDSNLRLLLQLLTSSIMEVTSSYQNSSFQLIKILIDNKVMLPEMYDLIDKLIIQSVISHRKGIRDSSSATIVNFLITYPIGPKQYQTYIKKLLANCHYEYDEGRQSTLFCLSNLIRLMNSKLLDEYAQMIFLPITLLCINDDSLKCRQAGSELLIFLTKKVSPELFMTFYNYSIKWLSSLQNIPTYSEFLKIQENSDQILGLIKTGAKIMTILISAQSDILKKSLRVHKIIKIIKHVLVLLLEPKCQPEQLSSNIDNASKEGDIDGGTTPWAITYQLLLLIEKLYQTLPDITDDIFMNKITASNTTNTTTASANRNNHNIEGDENDIINEHQNNNIHMVSLIEELLLYRHVWVSAASCRILYYYLHKRNPKKLLTMSKQQSKLHLKQQSPHHQQTPIQQQQQQGIEILITDNFMYQTARRLCIIINRPYLNEVDLSTVSLCLIYLMKVFILNPSLATFTNTDTDNTESNNNDTNDIMRDNIENEDEDDDENNDDIDDNNNNDDEDEADINTTNDNIDNEEEESDTIKNAASWIMQRLRGIGADSRGQRRLHVLKVRF